jgi:hypothetical protein
VGREEAPKLASGPILVSIRGSVSSAAHEDTHALETAIGNQPTRWKWLPHSTPAISGLLRRALPWIAIPVGLSFVTYTQTGYQYRIWPQLFLEYMQRHSGKLRADWTTSYPDAHWAFTHALELVPTAALSSVVFVLWALGLVGLWLAFASLCRALGVPWLGVVGAGLLAVFTGFAGLGLSAPVTGFLYPVNLAFAFTVAALAALLHGRAILSGAFLGLATLIHPQVGALFVPVIVIGAFYFFGANRWRRLAELIAAFLVPAAPALYVVLTQQAFGSSLPSHRLYDLSVIVRAPWHFLYRAFTTLEYAESLSWVAVLVVALFVLRARRERGTLAVALGACVAISALGAIASQIGRPLFLIQLQTAHLSSLAVLLGIVAAAAALGQFVGAWTGPMLMLTALLTPLMRDGLLTFHHLPGRIATLVNTSSVEAWAALVLVVGLAWATSRGTAIPSSAGMPRIIPFAFACTLAVTAVSLIGSYQTARAQTLSQAQQDWRAVAERAKQVSSPADQVLVPPEQDLFSLYSDRPVVVTFGSFGFSAGASQWVRRMNDVTGNSHVLEPSLMSAADRTNLIATSYDRTVASSAAPICRYDVKLVVVSSSVTPPRWLSLVEKTPTYALYKVSRPPCSSPKATAP